MPVRSLLTARIFLLCFVLGWLNQGRAAQSEPLGTQLLDIWRVEIVSSDPCLEDYHGVWLFRPGILPLWNHYFKPQWDRGRITAQEAMVYSLSDFTTNPPPPEVLKEINDLGHESSFSGLLSPDGQQLTGTEIEWCFWWTNGALSERRRVGMQVTASRIASSLAAKDSAGTPLPAARVEQPFALEVTLSPPQTWKRVGINWLVGDQNIFLQALRTEDGRLYRTDPLVVIGAPPEGADLAAAAANGRLYAAVGDSLTFALMTHLDRVVLPVSPEAIPHLASPRVDEQDLQVARGLLAAEIEELERAFAEEQREIGRQSDILAGLIEAAGLRNAILLRLEERRETLAFQLATLAIDRAALPADLQALLSHQDYLQRDQVRLEQEVLDAQARGDARARDKALHDLEQIRAQLTDLAPRIAALWVDVPESGDDLRPTTPQQLERARVALQQAIDALVPEIAEARGRLGFDTAGKARAEAALDAATERLMDLGRRSAALESKRVHLARPFGYIKQLAAMQDGELRFRAEHEDLEKLTAALAQVDRALDQARAELGEIDQISWRLHRAFLRAVDAVSEQEAISDSASWSSLIYRQFGVEVGAATVELGVATMTGGRGGLVVEAIAKLTFNIIDLLFDTHPIKSFDTGQLSALFVVAKDNAEMAYGATALLDEQDTLCRHADAAGGAVMNLSRLEPALFPSGAVFDRFGWPAVREALAMPLKASATFALENMELLGRLQDSLIDQEARRQIRQNSALWLETTVADFDGLVAGERLARAEVKAAESALTQLRTWRQLTAKAGIGLLVSLVVNVSKQQLEEWIRSVEGQAYVTFFETQLAMSQAWRAYMGAVCLRWTAQDRVERLAMIQQTLVQAFDLDLGFIIEVDKAIDPEAELIVSLALSREVSHPFGLEIAGVAGEPLPGLRFFFPAGSLAQAPWDKPLPVVVKVLRPPS